MFRPDLSARGHRGLRLQRTASWVQEIKAGRFRRRRRGLKAGDIITTIDGRSIKDGMIWSTRIASRRPGARAFRPGPAERRQADRRHSHHCDPRIWSYAENGKQSAEEGTNEKARPGHGPSSASWSARSLRPPPQLHASGMVISRCALRLLR